MTQGFLLALVVGFLGTMIPRRSGGPPLSGLSLVTLAAAIVAVPLAAFAGRIVVAEAAAAVVLAVLGGFAIRSFASRVERRPPPPSFVLIPIGLFLGLAGACLVAGGVLAGYPIKDVKVRLFDGQHHSVDSSEMAFKICASMGFKDAMGSASPALLEPIAKLTILSPDDCVGDVIGDLNSRRGHPLGMEPKGTAGTTEIVAEVPMAEVLDYAPALRAITGGRGDYTLEFDRHEQVPAHLAEKVIAAARAAEQAA